MSGIPVPDVRSDFYMSAASQLPRGYTTANIVGFNQDVDAGVEEDVWNVGGTYVFPSDSGEAMEVVSDNAGDTVEVVVTGKDEKFVDKSEQITLNGTTAVNLGGLWSRIESVFNNDSTVFNGNISVQGAGGGTVFSLALTADQESSTSIFTVPAGKTAFLKLIVLAMNKTGGATGNATFSFKVRLFGKVFRSSIRLGLQSSATSFLNVDNVIPQGIPEKTDVKFSVLASANDTDVSCFYSMIMIDNSQLNKYRGG